MDLARIGSLCAILLKNLLACLFQSRYRSRAQWPLSILASTQTRWSGAWSLVSRHRSSRGDTRDNAWNSVWPL